MKTDLIAKKKVLICDDDRTHLLILNETLKAQGYDVVQAENGEIAFETYCRFLPDIVLLDVKMPILNGYEVCTKIRATTTGQYIPILMITGSDDYESIEKAFEVGSTDFLSKPIKWSLNPHRIKYMLRSQA
jgi:two-component system sensor histidine kinase ChiS